MGVKTEEAALVEEATKKSGLVWVNGRALWHGWAGGGLCVVGGPGEQPLPGLVDGGAATVTVRSKDKGGRLVTWTGKAELLAPRSEKWDAAVAELKGRRLNAPDGEHMVERWARECEVFRVVPEGELLEAPGTMPAGSGAAVPVATPATTRGEVPAALPRLLARRRKRA
ncbi:hypothetical protein ITX44_24765 [Streptomyces sp. KK5PA1]|uniref:Uncharacterized protein n=1 Tax=Actinacidiphila acididurans TaxID=2784346 RepID=A0ABS2TWI4_9ACTN|nr:hypothetical protein [Actinacidiphila acididurans]